MATRSVLTYITVLVCVAAFALLCWRATLPCNRHRGGIDFQAVSTDGERFYLPRDTFSYENVVTQTVVHNFVKDGFWRTCGLPNRKGHPRVSLYDVTHTMCEAIEPPRHVLDYRNLLEQRVSNVSANNDCIYIHYPPLGEWVYAVLAELGFDTILHFKLFAISCNCLLLAALYAWLRREVSEPAALVAVSFAASVRAFTQWADVISYHPLQYLFLFCGGVSWSCFLRRPHRLTFGLTWVLYFCESLASYQLTLFFAILLLGLLMLGPTPLSRRTKLLALFVQGTAPVAAFGTHFTLIAGLIGLDRARTNVAKTFFARAAERLPGGIEHFLQCVNDQLLPWAILALGIVVSVLSQLRDRAVLQRSLGLLATLLLGGFSFMAVMPGTTSWHSWMMYRHFMPLVLLTVAYVAEALGRSLMLLRRRTNGTKTRDAGLIACCVLVGAAAVLGTAAWSNVRNVLDEIRWNREKCRSHDPRDQVSRLLDVVHWASETPHFQGSQFSPIIGPLEHEPKGWISDLRIHGPGAAHYELWWLEPVAMRSVRLLTRATEHRTIAEQCRIGFFDGVAFHELKQEIHVIAHTPNQPRQGESDSLQWTRFMLGSVTRAQALRLSCRGERGVAFKQLQVFAE